MTRTQPRQRLEPDARRAAILTAAAGEFAAAPYTTVAVAAIARAAGASEALVFKYFQSKASLYAAVVQRGAADLAAMLDAADDALPVNSSARDRVRGAIDVYLDHVVATDPAGLTLEAGNEPPEALVVRRQSRADFTARIATILQLTAWARHDYALAGFCGFLDSACLAWTGRGCPPDDRHALIAAALGCLEGALGDWGR